MAELRESQMLRVHSTTGRPLTIRYDARTNAVAFEERDWHADSFRLGHEGEEAMTRRLPRQQLSVRRRRN